MSDQKPGQSHDQSRLQSLAQSIGEHKRPPLHLWNPSSTGSIDIVIRRDGSWIHEGSEIKRAALVRLFASILRLEDGKHYLVTPVEKLEIQVEDAPFVAVAMDVFNQGNAEQVIAFRSNIDENVIAGPQNKISVSYTASGEPSPYVVVRDQLQALIGRATWLELAELATQQDGITGVFSSGMFFALSE